jgi:hypothetical protein
MSGDEDDRRLSGLLEEEPEGYPPEEGEVNES